MNRLLGSLKRRSPRQRGEPWLNPKTPSQLFLSHIKIDVIVPSSQQEKDDADGISELPPVLGENQ